MQSTPLPSLVYLALAVLVSRVGTLAYEFDQFVPLVLGHRTVDTTGFLAQETINVQFHRPTLASVTVEIRLSVLVAQPFDGDDSGTAAEVAEIAFAGRTIHGLIPTNPRLTRGPTFSSSTLRAGTQVGLCKA
jgi:hypothetical protein